MTEPPNETRIKTHISKLYGVVEQYGTGQVMVVLKSGLF
jgi:hypothetical protein